MFNSRNCGQKQLKKTQEKSMDNVKQVDKRNMTDWNKIRLSLLKNNGLRNIVAASLSIPNNLLRDLSILYTLCVVDLMKFQIEVILTYQQLILGRLIIKKPKHRSSIRRWRRLLGISAWHNTYEKDFKIVLDLMLNRSHDSGTIAEKANELLNCINRK